MRLIKALVLLALVGLSVCASAVPAVLIVHLKPAKGAAPLTTPICDFLANELQSGGKLIPIVWGLTDPIYRAAVDENKIKLGNETPTLAEALGVAGKLRAEYVLATDLRAGQSEVLGAAYLYHNGKLVWRDPNGDLGPALAHLRDMLKQKKITQEDFDQSVQKAGFRSSAIQVNNRFGQDDTVHSLARTWAEMLSSGPLLGLVKQPEKNTPAPGKGENLPSNDNDGGDSKTPVDNKWNADAAAALKAGDAGRAVSILRDAIDVAPMDTARRGFLIKALIQVGQPEVAAKEARRAAELMPDHIEFRALAARAWIQSGNVDEAQSDLNEAVSRAPDSAETRVLLAEVSIAKGDSASAIGHLDKAIAVSPTGDSYYLRGLAHALAGEVDLAGTDVKKAGEAGLSNDPDEAEARYALAAAMFDDGLAAVAGDVRTLQQKAQVQRTDADLKSAVDDLLKRANGRSQFVSMLPAPASHELSHNRRVLAHKLLSQCLIDLESYLKSGDGDVLTDSRINLGEALKQAASARQRFKEEQQGTKKSDGKSGYSPGVFCDWLCDRIYRILDLDQGGRSPAEPSEPRTGSDPPNSSRLRQLQIPHDQAGWFGLDHLGADQARQLCPA